MRAENRTFGERWTLFEGVEAYYARYDDNTFQRLYRNGDQIQTNQNTKLGIFGWGAFASAQYKTPDDRLTATVGLRLDGCNYSSKMARFWENLSPTVSLSYRVLPQLAINAAAGLYHQLPPYTALGYTDASGGLANKSLKYMRVANINLGTEWNVSNNVVVSLEGFFKRYSHMPLSVTDGIPLACKGNDYGVVGNELLVSKADGRAYGVETCMRWQIAGKLTSVASLTLFRSEYRRDCRKKAKTL